MRNPKRIPEVLDEIKKTWARFPDLRLGQLIENVVGRSPQPLFYIEDEDLVKRMEKFSNEARVA